MRTSWAAGALTAMLAIAGAACSDDGGVTGGNTTDDSTDESTDEPSDDSINAWVATLCTSLDDWITNLELATEDVQDVLNLQGEAGGGDTGTDTGTDTGNTGSTDVDLDEQVELLADFLDTSVELTETLIDELEDAGVPDTEDGEEIAEVFLAGFNDARDIFAEAREQVDDVPTDDPEDFEEAVLEIGDEIDIAAIEIQTAFNEAGDDFDTTDLDEAYEEEEACEALQ